MNKTKIWFDTEFIENGKTIDLISIGLVREDGKEYYAESAEYDESKASTWVKDNVLNLLHGPVKSRLLIAQEIIEFVGPNPEFWAYCADYDWVALCQLYGPMINLPKGWPNFCIDLKQQIYFAHNPKLPELQGNAHDALDDARWNQMVWKALFLKI